MTARKRSEGDGSREGTPLRWIQRRDLSRSRSQGRLWNHVDDEPGSGVVVAYIGHSSEQASPRDNKILGRNRVEPSPDRECDRQIVNDRSTAEHRRSAERDSERPADSIIN